MPAQQQQIATAWPQTVWLLDGSSCKAMCPDASKECCACSSASRRLLPCRQSGLKTASTGQRQLLTGSRQTIALLSSLCDHAGDALKSCDCTKLWQAAGTQCTAV